MKTKIISPSISFSLLAFVLGSHTLTGQELDPSYTSQFFTDSCEFSAFGNHPYFPLTPGLQIILEGEEDGESIHKEVLVLDEIEPITMNDGRVVHCRVIRVTETIDGELYEIARDFYASCRATGDVYYFGEDVEFYEDGVLSNTAGTWRVGVDGAEPGLLMPGSFLIGSRYYQEVAPGIAEDQAENIAMGLSITVPGGTFANCIQINDTNPMDDPSEPEPKLYAPGIGLISDDEVLEMTEFHIGTLGHLPGDCTFSTYSNNPYFPFAPGQVAYFEGEEDGESITLTISVTEDTKDISIVEHGSSRIIPTRIIEERETIDGELYEVSRNYFAQCVETGDVYYFGEEVDFYEDGEIINHVGAWEAGVDGALPGIQMPATFVVGADYFQEVAPEVAMDRARNVSDNATLTVPAGTFEHCYVVDETNPLEDDSEVEPKTYARGIGLISDAGVLNLISFTPGTENGLGIVPGMILTWAQGEENQLESSLDLETWSPASGFPTYQNGLYQQAVPRNGLRRFFRLVR